MRSKDKEVQGYGNGSTGDLQTVRPEKVLTVKISKGGLNGQDLIKKVLTARISKGEVSAVKI